MGIVPRGLNLLFCDGVAQKVAPMVLEACKYAAALMEDFFGVGVDAPADHPSKQLGIMVLGKEWVERARRLRLGDNGVEVSVPVILYALRIFMQDCILS